MDEPNTTTLRGTMPSEFDDSSLMEIDELLAHANTAQTADERAQWQVLIDFRKDMASGNYMRGARKFMAHLRKHPEIVMEFIGWSRSPETAPADEPTPTAPPAPTPQSAPGMTPAQMTRLAAYQKDVTAMGGALEAHMRDDGVLLILEFYPGQPKTLGFINPDGSVWV
ncbi:hypothetical protein ACFXGA_06235 [Actinosynnema sp. NPDC059335]|uniref:hypothetical protein n=1 Tax=Actinosynnema sp. NPDC059335 TaxID=3346804 RepID=UPI00367164F8